MITIDLGIVEETQEFTFVAEGSKQITVTIDPENLSVQIPGGVEPSTIVNNQQSFFLRVKDRHKKAVLPR